VVVVWRDGSEMNGTELVLNGIALDRAKDDTTGEFGLRDVRPARRCTPADRRHAEIKLFASTFLAGMANGLQQLQTQTSALGVTQIATGSARDAGLQGTADVLNAYARQIQEAIARMVLRPRAGREAIYLYVTQTIDQAQGTRGNRGWKISGTRAMKTNTIILCLTLALAGCDTVPTPKAKPPAAPPFPVETPPPPCRNRN